jgi:hypothetical protein
VANISIDKNLLFVYKEILQKKAELITSTDFIKEFLKILPSKSSILKRNIDSEIKLT